MSEDDVMFLDTGKEVSLSEMIITQVCYKMLLTTSWFKPMFLL